MDQSKSVNFGFGSRLPVIVQTEASECGLACIAMIASGYGYGTDLSELRKRFPISLKGATLELLISIADELSLAPRALRLELDELHQLQTPCILHWDLNHFVVLKSVKGKFIHIHDPAVGEVKHSFEKVSEHFTGIALELTPGVGFQRKSPPPSVQISKLVGKVVGLKRGLVQLVLLAIALEGLGLLLPILTQWITDEAIVGGDEALLAMLGIGMVIIGVSLAIIGSVRSWIGIYISTTFSMQWMSNIMGHLLRLPVNYFERRHLGDIVSRFGAIHAIEHTLTSASVDIFLDGLLALGTLIMMLAYSPMLAAITIAVVLIYGLIRWARYSSVKFAQTGIIAKSAREQTYFLETIRGVRSIKLNNRENERRSAWINLVVDSTNANLVLTKLNLFFSVSWSILATVERAGVLWLGAHSVIRHNMTLGMLFAFLGYKEQFAGRVNALIDRIIEIKMLSVQTERLADIVLSPPEENFDYRKHDIPEDLTLFLDRVSYRYSKEEPYLLNGATLEIKPGECIAIVGSSGCGKTTCMKIMLGILEPVGGKVKLGGREGLSLKQIGLSSYRNLIATVLQDDQLFAGSLFDNICFLENKPDEAWMIKCARTAGIHEEILDMPMGYHTLVGDMGTVLSGGQKQRVLLARALYRRPKILFLDEATSHLDVENEVRISDGIATLDITRIMIAHRPQTIAIADRVLKLDKGKFVDVSSEYGRQRRVESSSFFDSKVLTFPVIGDFEAANVDFVRAVSGGQSGESGYDFGMSNPTTN